MACQCFLLKISFGEAELLSFFAQDMDKRLALISTYSKIEYDIDVMIQ